MPSNLEALSFGSLNLNDQTTWFAESLVIAPASKRLQRLASPDADFDILAEVARYELRQVTLKLRYVASGATVDTALVAINDLSGRLQQAEEIEEGVALTWTPANSTKTGTMYVQSGEITDLPVVVDGEDSGWFQANPVVTVRFDCNPFIYGAEYSAATASSSSSRILTLTAASVPGTVPGLGRLVITDTGSQNRAHIEWGADRYGHAAAPSASFDILGSDMTSLGGTLTGSGSGSYQSMSVGSAPVSICEKSGLANIGPHNVRAQVERTATGTTLRVRAAARTVDGPWQYTPWRTVPTGTGTYDLRLGSLDFLKVKQGTQTSTLRIEAYASAASTLRVYRINSFPTEVGYGVARALAPIVISTASGYTYVDGFNQSAGALSGKSPDAGSGTWTTSGSTTDFAVVAGSSKNLQRSTLGDSGPRFGVLGSATGAQAAKTTVTVPASSVSNGFYGGALVRYVDGSNYLVAMAAIQGSAGTLAVFEYVSGTPTLLASVPAIHGTSQSIAIATIGGAWVAQLGSTTVTGFRTSLDGGGALASGKVGLYDYATASSGTSTRVFDDFYSWTPTSEAVAFSGRSAQVAHDHAQRESSGGSTWGNFPSYRGTRLFVPPAGPTSLTTRIVIKDRRNDVDGGQPDSADTARSATLYVTPRYLVAPS